MKMISVTESPLQAKPDVSLMSEILREFIPYRVMATMQQERVLELLEGTIPHPSWYFDAWVISNAYRILSTHQTQSAIELALIQLLFSENQDGPLAQEPE